MPVDLRSDTVTRPTPAMRRAMADAEVGDDVYGEDPTVNELEAAFAERMGRQAALYVPSGTMANQLAQRVLARPGSMIIAGRRAHVVAYEAGAGPYNTGAQLAPVDDTGGCVEPAAVAWALEARAHHQPDVSLVCIENTHMPSGGAVVPVEQVREIAALGVPVHLDGARLWHAAVATGLPESAWAAEITTVMCCLSKGLCAPVGSVLAGDADVIAEARAQRQRLGGGMRQAGIIAAAGLVAMRTMVERLADDHRRAAVLAEAVGERWPGVECHTNMVVFTHPGPAGLIAHLQGEGVLAGTIAPGVVRLVTHADVDDAGIELARKALATAPA